MEEETNSTFKFLYEKLVMRFGFVLPFFAFIGVFVYAYYAEVTMKTPGEMAPFSENLAVSPIEQSLAEAQALPMDQPHRTNGELQGWINTAVSEALFIDSDAGIDEKVKRYFTQAGFDQYQNYLTTNGVLESLRANNYRMSVYIDEQPLFLNGTAMDSVYRWLYQLPITVSFIPRGASDLIQSSKDIVNRELMLKIQIRRVDLPDDPDAVQIESWVVTGRRG